jgi:hypothetical protein
MKTKLRIGIAAGLLMLLSGCVYEPYGYVRPDSYYGDAYYGTYYDDGYYAAPGYYYDPWYYGYPGFGVGR